MVEPPGGGRCGGTALLYRALVHVRPGRLLPERLAYRLRRRVAGMPAPIALAAVEALAAAGVDAVVAGGWGMDALLGHQSRRHGDLDLLVHPAGDGVKAAARVLAGLGYRVVDEAAVGAHWAPVFTVVRDDAGHSIELLPAQTPPDVATGTLERRPVRCLSAAQQLDYHRGYQLSVDQRADVVRLRRRLGLAAGADAGRTLGERVRGVLGRWYRRRESAVVVLVPDAEPVVSSWRLVADPSAAVGVPAHVTVLYPFLPARRLTPAVIARLARTSASVPAFGFTLDRVGRFPGVVYLGPDRPDPFLDLLAAVQGEWPGLEPYRGRFETVVPHLTVAEDSEPDGLVAALEAALPVRTRAEELALLVRGRDRRWRVGGRFPLGRA